MEQSVSNFYRDWFEMKTPLTDLNWFKHQEERKKAIKRHQVINIVLKNCPPIEEMPKKKRGRKKK